MSADLCQSIGRNWADCKLPAVVNDVGRDGSVHTPPSWYQPAQFVALGLDGPIAVYP